MSELSIEVGGPSSPAYKSLSHLVWNNIPMLSVLTGVNGSGKTHLLEFLAYKLTGASSPSRPDPINTHLRILGDTIGKGDVAYIPVSGSFGGVGPLALAQLQQIKQQLYQQLYLEHHIQGNMNLIVKRARLEKSLGVDRLEHLTSQQFEDKLPDDMAYMLDDSDVLSGLSHVFLSYRARQADIALRYGESLISEPDYQAELKGLGDPPWKLVNDILQVAEFSYRVNSPAGNLLNTYNFSLVETISSVERNPVDLSSGEKVILQLALWLYNSRHHNRYPKLFLLDEPDAHLHPSMARQFMEVVHSVLVKKHNVRVIIATHSPSTVALAPDSAIFEMSKTHPRVRKSSSKAETIGLLTSGFVVVSPGSRYVLVEDENDVKFYNGLRDILTDYGPNKDQYAILSAPSIVFIRASIGNKADRVPGGKSVVRNWVEKLSDPPLNEFVRGVIDRDDCNQSSEHLYVVGRYSLENYLLDPFVVIGVLIEVNACPEIQGLGKLKVGDESLIRGLSQETLQHIVDTVRKLVEPYMVLNEKDRQLKKLRLQTVNP